jgi:hypothetical protein
LLNCVPRTLNNTSCSTSYSCRVDLGLSCQNFLCQCSSASQFWLASASKCVNLLSYSVFGCTADSHCNSTQNLICNLNPVSNKCDCPTSSVSGMCDCKRISGSEYFWDSSSSKCVPAVTYSSSCAPGNDYKCRTLTELTYCRSNKCNCSDDYYWNSVSVKCGLFQIYILLFLIDLKTYFFNRTTYTILF